MIYNYLTEENARCPGYTLNCEDMYFDIYLSYDKKLYIAYCYDSNYVAGVYFTSLNSFDEMKEIFDYCLNTAPTLAAMSVTLDKDKDAEYRELDKGLRIYVQKKSVKKADGQSEEKRYRVLINNCPVGAEDTGDNVAHYIASTLCDIYTEAQEKIKALLADGSYPAALKQYCDKLTEPHSDYRYYDICKPIGDILKEQAYMHLCTDDNIRRLFLKAQEAMAALYQEMMRSAR